MTLPPLKDSGIRVMMMMTVIMLVAIMMVLVVMRIIYSIHM